MLETAQPRSGEAFIDPHRSAGCRLWIDGVGCWLIWFRDKLLIGNASASKTSSFRFQILADIRSEHLRWIREEGHDWIDPRGSISRGAEKLSMRTLCRSRELFWLENGVELEYVVPSPLSQTAVLRLTSDHRSAQGFDGVVLFQQTCLLGPAPQTHIRCPRWQETLLLYERDGKLWAKMHEPAGDPVAVQHGQILDGTDWRMRIEKLEL
jgi:hypothetical protein